MNARPTAAPASLLAAFAASVRTQAKAAASERLDAIRAKAVQLQALATIRRQRVEQARADMASLKRRRSTQQ